MESVGRKIFLVVNACFLVILALICLLPFINLLAISLSSVTSVAAGEVNLIPVGFNTKAYEFVLEKPEFLRSVLVSLKRVLLGTAVNMFFVILVAYPLSREVEKFKARTFYVWIFVFTMFFSGGLIPLYMVVKYTGLMDSIWALVLPGAVPVWNVVLLLNFFRTVPKELEEAAFMDGAGYLRILWKVFLPVSTPAIATILLLTLIGHWNSWFDGIIYMNSPEKYPLQSYLQTLIIQANPNLVTNDDIEKLRDVSSKTVRTAQIFLGALPILAVYPFLQGYFVKGIVLGSVKE